MQRTMKTRFMAFLLAAVMVVGLTPINAFATDIEDVQETTEVSTEPNEKSAEEDVEESTETSVETKETTEIVDSTELEDTDDSTEPPTEEVTKETTQPEEDEEYDFPNVDSMTDAELLAYYAGLSDEEAEAFALSLTEKQLERLSNLLYGVELCGESSETHTVFKNTQSTLAPGVTQNIKYAYAADGKQMVYYIATADVTRDDVVVQSSYLKQYENKELGMSKLTEQAAYANQKYTNKDDALYISDYYNVVAGVNSSFYNMQTGQPLGITFIDGVSFGTNDYDNFFAILKDGKTAVIDYASNLSKYVDDNGESTIWQAAAGSQWLVRDGEDVTAGASGEYNTTRHSRTCVGVTAEGKVVLMVLDGRQEPFSCGGTMHELAQIMLEAGCVVAINLDGGGSTTFASKPEGENTFRVVNNPSDGSERSISAGIIIASTTAPSNVFDHVTMVAADEYVTPSTSTEITLAGVSPAGTTAEIPADVTYTVTNGAYENGVLTAGEAGDVVLTAQYGGKDVGSVTIHCVIPETISFSAETITVPYGKSLELEMSATYGLNEVKTKVEDFLLTLENENAGTLEGLTFTACEENTKIKSTKITATFAGVDSLTATATLTMGKGSQVLWDFEDGDISNWARKNKSSYNYILTPGSVSLSSAADGGIVHSGDYALRFNMDFSVSTEGGYLSGQLGLNNKEVIDLGGATSFGMWIYVPIEAKSLNGRIYLRQVTERNEDGSIKSYDKSNNSTDATMDGNSNWNVGFVTQFEESGWHYISFDLTTNGELGYCIPENAVLLDIYINDRDNTQFNYNHLNYKSLNQNVIMYVDDVTLDYSSVVDDREAPIFSGVTYADTTMSDAASLSNKATLTGSIISFTANVSEDTSKDNATGLDESTVKAYVDGYQASYTFDGSKITVADTYLVNGNHTVKFSICDKQGNYASIIRTFTVNASGNNGASVKLEPHDASLDKILLGSVYYVDVVATNVETTSTVVVDLDLNNISVWELDHMEVAEGFKASYSIINSEENIARISITRTKATEATGEMALVSMPIRTWELPCAIADYGSNKGKPMTYEIFKKGSETWPIDIQVTVVSGLLNGSTSFAGDTAQVDTESYVWDNATKPTEYATWNGGHDHRAWTKDYYSASSTNHVDAVALEDKAATCTESGYTGRTYCEVCHSVVEWGTTVAATGHTYESVGGVLKCIHDGCNSLYNGVYTDGNTYADGVIADGWVTIDGNTYYFVSGTKVTGAKYMGGSLYFFDEDGVYDEDYVYSGFYTTDDGRLMYFVLNKYVTGYHRLFQKAYFFEGNGYAYDGEYTIGGETCQYKEGLFVSCSSANVLDAGLIGTTAEYVLYADGTLKISGTGVTYSFSDHGQRPYVTYATQVKKAVIGNGITRLGTYLFCYCSSMTEVEFEEDSSLTQIGTGVFCECSRLTELTLPDSVAYISNMAFKSCPNLTKLVLPANITSISSTAFQKSTSVTLYVIVDSYGLDFAKTNNIPYVIYEHEVKREILEVDGNLYYYEDGVLTYAGLILLDGNYYYVRSNGQLVVGRDYWVTVTNDLLPEGTYTFGADGKMIVEGNGSGEEDKPVTDGIVDVDGVLYYYQNGNAYYAGLFQLDGNYYYARSNGQLVVSRDYWVTKTNDLLPAGTYTFDADGKMIVNGGDSGEEEPPAISIETVNGTLYCYKDGKAYYAGLFQFNGNYYYARSNGQLVVSRDYWVTKTNDLLPEGTYTFGADGKMIVNGGESDEEDSQAITIVTVDGTLYCYKDGKAYYAGLFQMNGSYYYARSNGQLVVSRDYWVTKTNDLLPAATYSFDADGKMITE